MKTYTNLHLDRRGPTAVITMDHPPANAWTHDALAALAELVAGLGADHSVHSLVLTGAGDKFFCAGADLNPFRRGDAAEADAIIARFGEAFEALADFRGVTIAAINGFATGGGLEAALACDVRIAEAQVKLGLPEARVGLIPAAGGTQRLPRLVGEGWAKRMILCGELVDAETALRIGLVEECVGRGEALERALALAEKAAGQSPLAVASCKRLINSGWRRPLVENLPLERTEFTAVFATEDRREGVDAFLHKREPVWQNR